ncbi:RNA polymerase sigma factor RpoD/SigA [Candidatus Ruminimicrobium bovinum]|uniref:sigma-70 family RNA polymerase sigma factor n=1 Tax=Candidatus Ruminimicrobium bovinum TaxID=3242779 RepID=UPI0039B9AB5A
METDSVESYFNDVSNIKPATKEELVELWKQAAKKDKSAVNRLVELNYRLVLSIAKKFAKKTYMDYMDLVADGNMGLVRAVEKFDPNKEIQFSTYATYWIEQYIRKSIENNSKMIRVPSHVQDEINRWKKIKNQFFIEHGKDPDIKKMAKLLNISVKQADSINRTIYSLENIDSIDSSIGDDTGTLKKETLRDNINKPLEAISEMVRTVDNVQEALKYLSEREEQVIRMRFGIDGEGPFSLEEIGERFNLSRERVRQIELKCFEKLKGIFIRLKFADKADIEKMVLDQRGTKTDRRQHKATSVVNERRRLTDRRR